MTKKIHVYVTFVSYKTDHNIFNKIHHTKFFTSNIQKYFANTFLRTSISLIVASGINTYLCFHQTNSDLIQKSDPNKFSPNSRSYVSEKQSPGPRTRNIPENEHF